MAVATTWRNIILDPIELAEIYEWIDSIPLSRPKGVIEKDFADGVLVAEIVKHYFPQIVDLRNYTHARNLQERMSNWRLLNGKIFTRLGLTVPEHLMTQLSIAKPTIVEVFLYNLRESIRSMMLYRDNDPKLGTIRTLYSNNDPYWYKYNMLAPQDPMFKYANMDFYMHRKSQLAEQSRGALSLRGSDPLLGPNIGNSFATKNNSLFGKKRNFTKSPANNSMTAFPPITSNGVASRLEVEEKTQEVLVKEEEIQTLKAKLKRLEHLLTLKDTRIEDLQSQVDKLRPNKRIPQSYTQNNQQNQQQALAVQNQNS